MTKLKPIVLAFIACGLLQACAPTQKQLSVQSVVRVDQPGNQAAGWNRLARFHHERGQLALALGAYAQSLSLDAGQLEARNAVAVIEAQQGDLQAARKSLVALVNDFPAEAQPHTNLGYVYYLLGEHAAATQTLRRAMALGAGPKAFQNLQLAEAALKPVKPGDALEASLLATAPAPAAPTAAAPAAVQAVPAASTIPTVIAAAAPIQVATPAATPAPAPAPAPVTPRPAPQMQSITPDARQIASRMDLVQLAPNVFELKQRVAVATPAAPAPAPVAVAAISPAPTAPAARPAPLKDASELVAKASSVQMARLEVANGNGVTGMAKRFRSLLGQMGIPVKRLSNDKPYRQMATTIQYSPGYEKQAESLQKALQGKAQMTSRQLQASDVRLVLGKDAKESLAAAVEAAGLTLVALQEDNN